MCEPIVVESDGDSLHDDHTDDHANAGLSDVHQSGDHRMKKVRGHRIIEPVT
jgi:hypothetical protein